MFVQCKKETVGDKIYHSVAFFHSYSEDGKIKHKTILNLSYWTPEQIDALESALKGKYHTSLLDIQVSAGKSFGSLFVLKHITEQLGVTKVFGNSKYLVLQSSLWGISKVYP